MKAVPKVNTDGLYLEDTLTDDAFTGVVPFYAEPPAPGPDFPPETDDEAADEQPEEHEPEIAGYIVGVPVPPGLYLPRFDLAAWEGYQEAMAAASEEYQAAYTEWDAQPEDERGEPPTYTAPEQPELWGEGLTPEEIEALHPPTEPTELELLQAELADIKSHSEQLQGALETANTELSEVAGNVAEQAAVVNTVGAEQVKQDLTVLDVKQQNAVLGAELVKKDIALLDLYNQNQVLGQMFAALELKILANDTGGAADV